MRRALIAALLALSACARPDAEPRESAASALTAVRISVSPADLFLAEGDSAFVTGNVRFDETLHGTPSALGWDWDADGAMDETFCTGAACQASCNVEPFAPSFSVQLGSTGFVQDFALGDLDGDGDDDAFVARPFGFSLVLHGVAGEFEVAINMNSYSGTAIADANGDTFGDLLIVSDGFTQGQLSLGGPAGFTGTALLQDGDAPRSPALADLDGDADLDAVWFDATAGSLRWSIYDSAALNMQPYSELVLTDAPVDLATGDVNGDGDADVILANTTPVLTIFLGNGAGGFGAPASVPIGANALAVAAGALTPDGFADVAVTISGGLLEVRRNTTGTFLPAETYADAGWHIAIGDLDADGDNEVVTTNGFDGTASVYRNSGNGLLSAALTHGLADGPVALGNVNGDARRDAVAMDQFLGELRVLAGNAQGRLGTVKPVTLAPAMLSRLRAADMNLDGNPDLIATFNGFPGTTRIHYGDGAGGFTLGPVISGSFQHYSLAVADLDGAGDLDVVIGTLNSGFAVSRSSTPGVYEPPTLYSSSSYTELELADVDADGDRDLVAVTPFQELQTWRNSGGGIFTFGTAVGTLADVHDLAIADEDLDGDLDVYLAQSASGGRLMILRNNGLGAFPSNSLVGVGGPITTVALGDFDQDGDVDAYVSAPSDGTSQFLRNELAGGFYSTLNSGFVRALDADVGDFTGDGKLDVAVVMNQPPAIGIFTAAMDSSQVTVRSGPSNPGESVLADFDNDGRLDIATYGATSNEIQLRTASSSEWSCVAFAGRTFMDSGNLTPQFRAELGSTTATRAFTVFVQESEPLIVGFSNEPQFPQEGDVVSFAADFFFGSLGDPITECEWDFGDGTVLAGVDCPMEFGPFGLFSPVTHVYADGDPTERTATFTLFDEDGSALISRPLEVGNAAPSVAGISGTAFVSEGDSVTLSSGFLDAAVEADAPYRVVWDDDRTPATDVVQVVPTSGTLSAVLTLAEEGTHGISLSVTDQVDGAGEPTIGSDTGVAFFSIEVADSQPALGFVQVDADPTESAPISVSSTIAARASDAITVCAWEFGEGGPLVFDPGCAGLVNGSTIASHTYADGDPTIYTVTLTVSDEDGFEEVSREISIANAPPPASLATAGANEGSQASATVDILNAGAGALDAPFRIEWQWGDGSTTTTVHATTGPVTQTHVYGDEAAYPFVARVYDQTDPFGTPATGTAMTTLSASLAIANAPPSLAAIGDQSATEGLLLFFDASASDPGSADALSFSLVTGPSGLQVSASGSIAWVPAYSQCGGGAGVAHPVTVQVADGDGGTATRAFTVRAKWRDDDQDGMADTWEIANGMDPTIDDSLGDADGDGVLNINEFNGAGPFTPNALTALSPVDSDEVETNDPTLLVQNTTDPDSPSLTYVFQLYGDAQLATLIRQSTVVASTSGMTSLVLDDTTVNDDPANPENVDLADDAPYWWRARATDGTHTGPWTLPERFVYDPVNDAPGVASHVSPVAGEQVGALAPALVAGNPAPDDDPAGTLTFRVFAGANEIRTSPALAQGPFGTTSWTVTPALAENASYTWTVTVTDAHGATTASAPTAFTVNLANDEPAAPSLITPADGVEVTSATPLLTAGVATDADGDALTHLFEVDVTPAFNTAAKQQGNGTACGANVCFTPANLAENTRHWWRVRASDGHAVGEPAVGSFFVNVANDAPTAPVALNPSESALVTSTTPALTVLAASDPEGSTLTYDFEVTLEAEVVASAASIAGASTASWTVDPPLVEGESYAWRARSTDAQGLAGEWSALATFTVYNAPKGGGGGGCTIGTTSPSMLSPLAFFALLAFRRRRSRRLDSM